MQVLQNVLISFFRGSNQQKGEEEKALVVKSKHKAEGMPTTAKVHLMTHCSVIEVSLQLNTIIIALIFPKLLSQG